MECIIAMFNYIIKIDFYWKDELWDEIYSLSLSSDLSEVRAEYTGGMDLSILSKCNIYATVKWPHIANIFGNWLIV